MDIDTRFAELFAKRDAVEASRSIIKAKQDKAFDDIMALQLDDPEFIRKHAKLNGQFEVLSELFCDLTSQLTGLVQETMRLHEKTFGKL